MPTPAPTHDLTADPIIRALAARVPGLTIEAFESPDERHAITGVDAGRPFITLSPDVADADDPHELYGAVAHEVAHHLLGHLAPQSRPRRWTGAALSLLDYLLPGPVFAFLLLRVWGVFLVLGAVYLAVLAVKAAVYLWDCWRSRHEELEADALSVRLLQQAGLPGRDVAAASLRASTDPWWARIGNGLLSTHPVKEERLRAVSGAPLT